MKNVRYYLPALLLSLALSGCDQFDDAADMEKVKPTTLSLDLAPDFTVDDSGTKATMADLEGLSIKLDNYIDDLHYQGRIENGVAKVDGVTPGVYNIVVSGKLTGADGQEYSLSGGAVNQIVKPGSKPAAFKVKRVMVNAPLMFSEIFFSGTASFYFRNQYYEIYNNSDEVVYLDGIYFANLAPVTATKQLPVWPKEDDGNYGYAERVWKFPGTGHDYPLQPGEAVVVSQFAANHKLPQYNPNSPVDCSASEFEFNMNNPNFPDQPAPDMIHVYYDGKAEMGFMPQYLVSVFGGAYVIFRVPEGETWDPVNDLSLQTKDASDAWSSIYAKVPNRYILDAVEAGHNETMIDAKRVPTLLDAGMTYVGQTYCSKSVRRKVALDDQGREHRRADGTPYLQDTNNSTDDFIHGVTPVFRAFGEKMPAWNHTLQGGNQ